MTPPAQHPDDALLALVYGELSSEEARRLQAHLDGCPECTATVAGYRAARDAARALPREVPPTADVQPLLDAAHAAASRVRRRRTLWRTSLFSGAAAAALALLTLRPTLAPQAPKGVASAPAPAPLPADALALNTAPPLGEPPAAREADVPRAAPAAAKPAKGAALEASGALARRQNAAPAQSLSKEAKKAEAPQPTAPAPAAGAPAASARTAAVAAPAPAAAAALRAASADASADAAQLRAQDEGRRQALLLRLKDAPAAQALPLLAELCALEERLSQRREAQATCTQLVQGYPGTPEAAAARAALQRLQAGPPRP